MQNKQIAKEARESLKNNFKKSLIIFLLYAVIFNITSFIKTPLLKAIIAIALIVIYPALAYGLIISFTKIHKKENVKILDFIILGFQNFTKAWHIIFRIFLKLWPQILTSVVINILTLILTIPLLGRISLDTALNVNIRTLYILIWTYSLILFFIIVYLTIVYPKSLYYTFSNYIMIDTNNSITAKEAVEKSIELMGNNRLKYFKLVLSFVGWYLLVVLIGTIISLIISFIIYTVSPYLIARILGIVFSAFISSYMQTANIHFYEALKQENNN